MDDHERSGPGTEALARIDQIAYERAIARLNDDDAAAEAGKQRFAEAMTGALMAGADLKAMTAAERDGVQRARDENAKDLLRQVRASAKAKREATAAHDERVRRAGRLLTDREIANAAGISRAAVRAIKERQEAGAEQEADGGEQHEGEGSAATEPVAAGAWSEN
jgi:hypothetical protein